MKPFSEGEPGSQGLVTACRWIWGPNGSCMSDPNMVDWRWSYPSGVGPNLTITYLSVGGICEWRQGPKDSKKIATHPYRTHPKQFPVHQLWKESLHSLLVKVCWNNLRKKFVEHFSSVKVILFYNVVSPETGGFFVGVFSPPQQQLGLNLNDVMCCLCLEYMTWLVVWNIFYVHPDPWENDPIWRAYFSTGFVQPPTSRLYSG